MWSWLAVIIVCCGTVAAVPTVNAEPVRLVTGNDYYPYADGDLPEGGITGAIVRAAYEDAGHSIAKIDFKPWTRAYQETLHGKYTATFPWMESPERRREMLFSDPIFTTTTRVAVRADFDRPIEDASDLHDLTYCTPVSYEPGRTVTALEDERKVDVAHPYRMTDCLRMLERGRVDFIPLEKPTIVVAALKVFGSTDPIRFADAVLDRVHLHVLFPKDRDGARVARDKFNAALARLRKSGRYDRIVDTYELRQ